MKGKQLPGQTNLPKQYIILAFFSLKNPEVLQFHFKNRSCLILHSVLSDQVFSSTYFACRPGRPCWANWVPSQSWRVCSGGTATRAPPCLATSSRIQWKNHHQLGPNIGKRWKIWILYKNERTMIEMDDEKLKVWQEKHMVTLGPRHWLEAHRLPPNSHLSEAWEQSKSWPQGRRCATWFAHRFQKMDFEV